MTRDNPQSWFMQKLPLLVFGAINILVLLIYLPMADGPLILDDKPNIVHNSALKISDVSLDSLYQSATSMNKSFNQRAKLLQRPVSYISFSLDWYLSGGNYQSLKVTNIFLHIFTGILLFLFLRQLLTLTPALHHTDTLQSGWQKWGPIVIAGFWLLHPLMVSTVLYSVQRMTILSALFSFCALNVFCTTGRNCITPVSGWLKVGLASVCLPRWHFYRKKTEYLYCFCVA